MFEENQPSPTMSTITGNTQLTGRPNILQSFNTEPSGSLPEGYRIACLGVFIDDTQRDPNGPFALAFAFDLPAGVALGAPTGSAGQAFDLSLRSDPGVKDPSVLYWGLWYMKWDAEGGNWEVDFRVSTPKGSSTYTLTNKRFP
jgi:hypothetical protein